MKRTLFMKRILALTFHNHAENFCLSNELNISRKRFHAALKFFQDQIVPLTGLNY
jgi:hypothetical protein